MDGSARLMTLQERIESEIRDCVDGIAQEEIDRCLERIKYRLQSEYTKVISDILIESNQIMNTDELVFSVTVNPKARIGEK